MANSTEEGDFYERLIQLQMRTDPVYTADFSDIWMAKAIYGEVPQKIRSLLNLPGADEGIDLIARSHDGEFTSIQAKYRSNDKPFGYTDLTNFMDQSFRHCNNISWGIWRSSTTKPVKKSDLIDDRVRFEFLERTLELDDEDGLGWKRIHDEINKTHFHPVQPNTRLPHQKSATKDALDYFGVDTNSRGRLIMPCATGKTFIGYWIAEDLKARNILIVVPTLDLVNQTLRKWKTEYVAHGITPSFFAVCSEIDSDLTKGTDSDTTSPSDLAVRCNTDLEVVSKFLSDEFQGPKVVLSTYASGPVLAEAARMSDFVFDLTILDEAHNTVGKEDKRAAHLLFDKNLKSNKRLFMTATEKQYRRRNSANIISMEDDSEIYGERFHQMSFKKAIDEDVISNYRVATVQISSSEIEGMWRKNKFLNLIHKDIEAAAQTIASGIALEQAFRDEGITKAISFHNSISKSKKFLEQQEKLHELMNPGEDTEFFHVSSEIPMSKRNILLKSFGSSDKALITNARCLTEGVDIRTVDCVLFVDPKQSKVDIVQAVGRALRPSKETGKTIGTILIPVIIPDEGGMEEVEKAWSEVVNIVRHLATSDERIVEELRGISEGRLPTGKIIDISSTVIESLDIDPDELVRNIQLKMWKSVARLNFKPFAEAREYVRGLNLKSFGTQRTENSWLAFVSSGELPADIPSNPDQVYTEFSTWGNWLGTQTVSTTVIAQGFRPIKEAMKFLEDWQLQHKDYGPIRTSGDYKKWAKVENGFRPPDIPSNPARSYRGKGWPSKNGWGFFLGTGEVSARTIGAQFLPYHEAEEYMHIIGLKSETEFRNRYAKVWTRPAFIPSNPSKRYQGSGWIDWPTFLGY